MNFNDMLPYMFLITYAGFIAYLTTCCIINIKQKMISRYINIAGKAAEEYLKLIKKG